MRNNSSLYYQILQEYIESATKAKENLHSFEPTSNEIKIDSSTNDSEELLWGYETISKITSYDDKKIKHLNDLKDKFISMLLKSDFDWDNEDDWLLSFVDENLHKNKNIFLSWIEQLFWDYQKNELVIVKILELFLNFTYDEVQPNIPTLSAACKGFKSLAVQSANLSLLGHWCNKRALEIMDNFENPQNEWMRIKYQRLREIISEKCITSEK